MIPPPSLELIQKVSESPRSLAIQSSITCSSSVHAGEHIHYISCDERGGLEGLQEPFKMHATHVEAWIAHASREKFPKHALETADAWKIGEESTMLPMGDTCRLLELRIRERWL